MLEHRHCRRCHQMLYTGQLHKTIRECLENALVQISNLRGALMEHERAMSFVLFGDEIDFAGLNRHAAGSNDS